MSTRVDRAATRVVGPKGAKLVQDADPASASSKPKRVATQRRASNTNKKKTAPQPSAVGSQIKRFPHAAAAALWAAFDEAVALFESEAGQLLLRWCSAAFAAQIEGTQIKATSLCLTDLCPLLDGLEDALRALGLTDAAASQAGSKFQAATEWAGPVKVRRLLAQEALTLHASLRRMPDGCIALRLQSAVDEGYTKDTALRRHLEDRERLLFTSRSVAVGEMATTLAHELNQPLGAVTNVLRGLKSRLLQLIKSPKPNALPMLTQGVQLALDQVQYASRIIGRIREYTQSRQPRQELVDLHALLHNSLTMLDWELDRHEVQLALALTSQTEAVVVGDGVMLQQVLVNLLRNAIDAMSEMPQGERKLTVSTCMGDAGYVELAIADTGHGIDDQACSQLFTPFFSSKPTGMGIGLNICRSLIELHQGRLWFTPNEIRGCTFHVALPLVANREVGQLPRFLNKEEPDS